MGEPMDIAKYQRIYKFTQIIGAASVTIGLTTWKVVDSFDPESPYYSFVTSRDFDLLSWIAVAAIMPAILGVVIYFALGMIYKKRLRKLVEKTLN